MSETTPTREASLSIPTFRPELAFPVLSSDMLLRLSAYGTTESVAAKTLLFTRGERDVDMFVVVDGVIEVYARGENESHITVATLGALQFTGELDLLSSRRNLVDAQTKTDSHLIRISRTDLQRLMRMEGDIANVILQATIWRRVGIVEHPAAGVLLVGEPNSAETIQLQRFLVRNGYPHRMADTQVRHDAELHTGVNVSPLMGLPAVVMADGRVLQRPTIVQLAEELGITETLEPDRIYDVAVVGAGPSGLAAAVYSASEGLSTLVIESTAPGGQAGTSSKIENYLGFPTGISGQELASRAQVQAQKFGARLAISREAIGIASAPGLHTVLLEGGGNVRAKTVVVATGACYRKLDVKNYSRFEYQGIHYAATAMEAALCRGHEVAIIGGGNSAGQAAVFLSGAATHVHLLIRGESLSSSMSDYLIQRIAHSPRITLHTYSDVVGLTGDVRLESVTWQNRLTGERETKPVRNMFVMIGAEPNTRWLSECVALDAKGFVLTGLDAGEGSRARFGTSVDGIFAVGDVRFDSVKRVASAVGEGSVVISDVHRYLQQLQQQQI